MQWWESRGRDEAGNKMGWDGCLLACYLLDVKECGMKNDDWKCLRGEEQEEENGGGGGASFIHQRRASHTY